MGKGVVLIPLGVVLLLVLFVVMVILTMKLEPPPLTKSDNDPSRRSNTINNTKELDPLFYNEGIFPLLDRPLYGLEKADLEEIYPFTPPNSNMSRFFNYPPRRVIPPLWPRPAAKLAINPTARPAWLKNGKVLFSTEAVTNRFEETSNITAAKPMKRRSVSNNGKENSGSIILKILDNVGHARIEIKLNADNKNITKDKYKESLQSMHEINSISSKSDEYEEVEYSEKAIIITPTHNDLLNFNESENPRLSEEDLSEITNITHLLNKLLVYSKNDIRKNNIRIEFEDKELEKKEQNTNNAVVNRFRFDIDKDSFVNNTTPVSVYNNTKLLSSIPGVQDIKTFLDIDTKINNTELNKIVFGYEETTNARKNNFSEVT